jgi:hypothetical protein
MLSKTALNANERLLPLVIRKTVDAPHPDLVVAREASRLGMKEANFASYPRTCDGCTQAIPSILPQARVETPKTPGFAQEPVAPAGPTVPSTPAAQSGTKAGLDVATEQKR